MHSPNSKYKWLLGRTNGYVCYYYHQHWLYISSSRHGGEGKCFYAFPRLVSPDVFKHNGMSISGELCPDGFSQIRWTHFKSCISAGVHFLFIADTIIKTANSMLCATILLSLSYIGRHPYTSHIYIDHIYR